MRKMSVKVNEGSDDTYPRIFFENPRSVGSRMMGCRPSWIRKDYSRKISRVISKRRRQRSPNRCGKSGNGKTPKMAGNRKTPKMSGNRLKRVYEIVFKTESDICLSCRLVVILR
jgi:hypothetical protein